MNRPIVVFWCSFLLLVTSAYSGWALYRYTKADPSNLKSGGLLYSEKDDEFKPSKDPITTFTLTERSGEPFESSKLNGKIWIGSFFFSSCPSSCFRMNMAIANLPQEIKNQVQIVSISCDPDNDTPEVLADYANRFQADPEKWVFLTGKLNLVRQIGNDIFGTAVQKQTHAEKLTLFDRNGEIKGRFLSTDPAQMNNMVELINNLSAQNPPGNSEIDEAVEVPADSTSEDSDKRLPI